MTPHLTARERQLYDVLRNARGRTVTHARLREAVWGDGYDASLLKMYVMRLRQKGVPIVNLHGVGYFMEADNRCPSCGRELPP